MGLLGRRKTKFVDSDVLVIGGGMAGCGATYEARYWGRDLKVVCVEKANIERSGAVAWERVREDTLGPRAVAGLADPPEGDPRGADGDPPAGGGRDGQV